MKLVGRLFLFKVTQAKWSILTFVYEKSGIGLVTVKSLSKKKMIQTISRSVPVLDFDLLWRMDTSDFFSYQLL